MTEGNPACLSIKSVMTACAEEVDLQASSEYITFKSFGEEKTRKIKIPNFICAVKQGDLFFVTYYVDTDLSRLDVKSMKEVAEGITKVRRVAGPVVYVNTSVLRLREPRPLISPKPPVNKQKKPTRR